MLVAPCTMRGRPRGAAFEGVARVLDPGDHQRAEAAVKANYGPERSAYMRLFGEAPDNVAYIEVQPSPRVP